MVFVLILGLAGCGNRGPAVQFVEGTVSVDGTPLEDTLVVFCPKDILGDPNNVKRPLMAGGTTDKKGYYRLSSLQGGAIGGGTTIGEYDVTIVKKTNTRPAWVPSGPGDRPPSAEAVRPIFQYDTPEIFERQETTPITVKVERGKNRFDFDLKSDDSFTVNGQ